MKTMFKYFSVLIIFFNTLLFSETINISEYWVVLKKLEIYNSTTKKWITVSEGSADVNIADPAFGPNSDIASMAAKDAAITFGTYTKVRATVANTFEAKACVDDGSGIVACTNGDDSDTINAHSVTGFAPEVGLFIADTSHKDSDPNNAISTEVEIDFSKPEVTQYLDPEETPVDNGTALQLEQTLSTPFIVDENTTSPSVSVKFNLNGAIEIMANNVDYDGDSDDYMLLFGAPQIDISIE